MYKNLDIYKIFQFCKSAVASWYCFLAKTVFIILTTFSFNRNTKYVIGALISFYFSKSLFKQYLQYKSVQAGQYFFHGSFGAPFTITFRSLSPCFGEQKPLFLFESLRFVRSIFSSREWSYLQLLVKRTQLRVYL